MSVLVLDAGNSVIKAKIARREKGELAFPHAIKPLTEAEYTSILSRSGKQASLLDSIRINGQPYVVGESAGSCGSASIGSSTMWMKTKTSCTCGPFGGSRRTRRRRRSCEDSDGA